MRGRIKGRVYADMLIRGLVKAEQRVNLVLKAVERFNGQATKYEHKPVPGKLVEKIRGSAKTLKEAGAKVGSL